MIKIILIILIAAVVLDMLSGINILKNNYYWRTPYFAMQYDYLKEEFLFAKYEHGGISNWLKSFKNPEPIKLEQSKTATAIPVLLYHGVIDNTNWHADDVNISLNDFREQMFALKKNGYQTITLSDYVLFTKGEKILPEKSFILTFDDGRKDSFYTVDPILRVLDYNAVMFVITNRSLGPNSSQEVFHLSEEELQKMIASGHWRIESHGKNDHDSIQINANGDKGHFLSNQMWLTSLEKIETEEEHKARIALDLLESKKDIERKLNTSVLSFAYPFGDFGMTTENFPESKGLIVDEARKVYPLSFCQASSSDFPTNYPESSFLAKRIAISSQISAQDIVNLFEYNQEKLLNYQDYFLKNNGWMAGRGFIEINNGSLRLKDSELEGSSIAFLGGSYLWDNYSVKANIRVEKTDSLALTARYHDQNNNVSCVFSDHYISLVQNINSKEILDIRNSTETSLSSGREAEIGILVNGDEASCFLDGKAIVNGTIDSSLSHGGVGFKVWDTLEKGSALIIRNFKAEKISSIDGTT